MYEKSTRSHATTHSLQGSLVAVKNVAVLVEKSIALKPDKDADAKREV